MCLNRQTLLVLAAMLASTTALARPLPDAAVPTGAVSAPALHDAVTTAGVSLDEAVRRVRARYPGGKVVRAETRGNTHHIRILDKDGRVHNVRVPAGNGR